MKLIFIWIPLFILNLVGFADNPAVPLKEADTGQAVVQQAPQDISDATNFKSAVKDWIAALTKGEGFETWKTAKWESLPVGPGTHSWLVTIRKDRLEVGYLIVGAMEDGKHYKLLEYGLGQQPLFSFNTLYQSMMQQALIDSQLSLTAFSSDTTWKKERFYLSTLENFWRITHGTEVYYLDAKTGEILLNSVDPLETNVELLGASAANPSAKEDPKLATSDVLTSLKPAQIKETSVTRAFDPFEKPSWVEGKPLSIRSIGMLKHALQAHPKLTYMTKLYQQKIIYPFALTGYQIWNEGEVYIALDDEGARYIPLSSLLHAGSFYP